MDALPKVRLHEQRAAVDGQHGAGEKGVGQGEEDRVGLLGRHADSLSGAAVRPPRIKVAPALAASTATARPVPDPAPMTTTVFPFKFMLSSLGNHTNRLHKIGP